MTSKEVPCRERERPVLWISGNQHDACRRLPDRHGLHQSGETQRITRGSDAFQYDSSGIGTTTISGTSASYTRTPGGDLLSERIPSGSSAGTYYYLVDGLGSVVALTNSSGSIVNSYSYDPYGKTISATEGVPNPFRYIGAVYDASTGW